MISVFWKPAPPLEQVFLFIQHYELLL